MNPLVPKTISRLAKFNYSARPESSGSSLERVSHRDTSFRSADLNYRRKDCDEAIKSSLASQPLADPRSRPPLREIGERERQ